MLNTQSMNLDLIRTFVIVGQSKDFNDAASKLKIDATNVSRHIKTLEQLMGTKLINKNAKNYIELTEDGQILFDGYEKAYNLLFITEKTYLQSKDLNSGKISIGISADIESTVLIDKIVSFKGKYSDAAFKTINLPSKDLVEKYIETTSVIDKTDTEEEVTTEVEETPVKEESKFDIQYTAVLEIPKINLKRGVVDNTKNFNSIRYAISVDNSSQYPNENGNFILYSHSGNSNIAFFSKLNQVEKDDDIYVYYSGITYHYKVVKRYDIEKTGKAKVINSNESKYITLITCNQNRRGYQIVIEGKIVDEISY